MNITNKSSNQYYVYLNRGQKPFPWNPPNPHPLDWVDYTYFGKVLEVMEKSLKVDGLIVYFTWNRVDELPSYGKNVVAVVVGDEWCRIPRYSHKVLAVFKCYGIKPTLGYNPFFKPSHLKILTFIKFLQVILLRFPSWLNYVVKNQKTPIYDIPLGYFKQLNLPIKNIEERTYDIFFAGSINHRNYSKRSFKYWFDNPKRYSRNKMVSVLEILKSKFPELKLELAISSSFSNSQNLLDKESYSQKLMNTKICLVPRGTSFETFRFFEAMRYGCIVIGEALPKRWFYEESPAIRIDDWSELEILLPRLLNDKALMQKKHQESLHWWQTKCSEAIVGNYMADQLNSLNTPTNIFSQC